MDIDSKKHKIPRCFNCGAVNYADFGLPDQVICLNCGMLIQDVLLVSLLRENMNIGV